MAEPAVLDGLRTLLGEGTDLQVRGTLDRRRATVSFVGLGGEKRVRWVVKQPDPTATQLGLRPPLSAARQLDALVRLRRHLRAHPSAGEVDLDAPRPVGLLPGGAAFAMDYVEGVPVSRRVTPAMLGVGRRRLLADLRLAGVALRRVHDIAPPPDREQPPPDDEQPPPDDEQQVPAGGGAAASLARARGHLSARGIPAHEAWFEAGGEAEEPAREVTLHGDWAPENLIVGPRRAWVIDPELARRGSPAQDLARFLVMLFDPPVFTLIGRSRQVRDRRRLAAGAFLAAYGVAPSELSLTRAVFVEAWCSRWSVRESYLRSDEAGRRLGGSVVRARQRLTREHFAGVLDEVTRSWPEIYPQEGGSGGGRRSLAERGR